MSRWDRVVHNATFAGDVLEHWHAARVGVVGAGLVGGRFAIEAARSGASVWVCDPEVAESANLGTQDVRHGEPKALSVAGNCNAIRAGSASASVTDVRHVGAGVLGELDLLVDCSDDRSLAPFLTEVSNGFGVPLLRLAVDGTGELELGRCLASHGGAGHACQLCGWTLGDLIPSGERTPCPGGSTSERPATLAGGAIGMATAAVGLLQAQRLIGQRDAQLVLDREVVLDLSHFGLGAMQLGRSSECVSGHAKWEVVRFDGSAAQTTPADLFVDARTELGLQGLEADELSLELVQHPLFVETLCACHARALRLGTAFVSPGTCDSCGREVVWRREVAFGRLREETARLIGAFDKNLLALGLPTDGALIVARCGARTLRYVLAQREPWRVECSQPAPSGSTQPRQEVTR